MVASSAAMGDTAFSLSCVVRDRRVELRQGGVGGAAVSITPRMLWKGRARVRATRIPLALPWRAPLRRKPATHNVAWNLRPPRRHARRALRPLVTLCRAALFPPSTFRGPRRDFVHRELHFREPGTARNNNMRVIFRHETTTRAVDSSRARRRGGARSRGRVAARCCVASSCAAGGGCRVYPAA